MSKGPERYEDYEATQPYVRKPIRPLSPLTVHVNQPKKGEDNAASLPLSGPQLSELFVIRDGEMGFNHPRRNSQLKATAKLIVCHNNGSVGICQQTNKDRIPTHPKKMYSPNAQPIPASLSLLQTFKIMRKKVCPVITK